MSSKKLDIEINSISPLLSEAIAHCRRALEISVPEFAKSIHKSKEFVYQLERAEIAITSQILLDCATALGISIGEIIEIALSGQLMLISADERSRNIGSPDTDTTRAR